MFSDWLIKEKSVNIYPTFS